MEENEKRLPRTGVREKEWKNIGRNFLSFLHLIPKLSHQKNLMVSAEKKCCNITYIWRVSPAFRLHLTFILRRKGGTNFRWLYSAKMSTKLNSFSHEIRWRENQVSRGNNNNLLTLDRRGERESRFRALLLSWRKTKFHLCVSLIQSDVRRETEREKKNDAAFFLFLLLLLSRGERKGKQDLLILFLPKANVDIEPTLDCFDSSSSPRTAHQYFFIPITVNYSSWEGEIN